MDREQLQVASVPRQFTARCTIIIPVCDRAAATLRCLEALSSQFAQLGGLGGLDVIVIDDGSTDITPQILEPFRNRVRIVQHASNEGFARSCNEGAALAASEFLIFIRGETVPAQGWLSALIEYADAHPVAGVVGSKLLFTDGTVAHAGVTICRDLTPRYIYAGFDARHPAVNRSRRFQAVGAGCVLIRRAAFDTLGGFDVGLSPGLEELDLSLRLGQLGQQVHYCAESVVYSLEAPSFAHGQQTLETLRGYLARWIRQLKPDDLEYYVEDGLVSVRYEAINSLRFTIAPELGVGLLGSFDTQELQMLNDRSRQVFRLLAENSRLKVRLGELREVHDYAVPLLKEREPRGWGATLTQAVRSIVPIGSSILLVVRTADEWGGLEGYRVEIRTPRTVMTGAEDARDLDAGAVVDELIDADCDYLVLPYEDSERLLAGIPGFAESLSSRGRVELRKKDVCVIYRLDGSHGNLPRRSEA